MSRNAMTPLPFDYHMHTHHSCDAHASVAEMCAHAVALGLSEVAITDHMDWHPLDDCTGYYQFDAAIAEIEACRARFPALAIRAGLEVGEPHRFLDEVAPLLDAYPYDLVIGSLHWLGDEIVFEDAFFEVRTPDQAAEDYFTEMARMVRRGGFEVLGHLDVVRRCGFDFYRRFDIEPYGDLIRPVLRTCVEEGIALEINTSGMRRALQQPFPSLPVLRWYKEVGGELLTVGSDAHALDQIGLCFTVARDLALQAGFTRLCRFERRQVVDWVAIE